MEAKQLRKPSIVGERISIILAERGWKDSDLARAAGVSRSTIVHLINGVRGARTSGDVIKRIAKAGGYTSAWLLGEEDDAKPKVRDPRYNHRKVVKRLLAGQPGYGDAVLDGLDEVELQDGDRGDMPWWIEKAAEIRGLMESIVQRNNETFGRPPPKPGGGKKNVP